MNTQQVCVDVEQIWKKVFHTSYAHYLSQGLEPNDAVAHALLEMQQLAAGGATPTSPSTVNATHDNVKMEDASLLCHEPGIIMETLNLAIPPASTSAELPPSNITGAFTVDATPSPSPGQIAARSLSGVYKTDRNMTATGDVARIEASFGLTSMTTQLEKVLTLALETNDFRVAKSLVYQVFSDPKAISALFLKRSESEEINEDEVGRQWWGIDRDQVQRVFSLLNAAMTGIDQKAMQNTFKNALEMLVTQPWNVCSTWHAPYALRGLCRLFYYLSEKAKALLRAQWLANYSADELHRLLDILQQAITICLYGSRKMDFVYAACGVLAELYIVNLERMKISKPFATYDEFYNDAINSEEARQREMPEIIAGEMGQDEADREENRMPERQLSEMSFCDFPFVLDAASKSKVLQIDSDIEQRARAQDAFLSRSNTEGMPLPYLVLKVRRENFVEDAMQQIVRLSTSADILKKPLKVKFVGEEGIDEGGVQNFFFKSSFDNCLIQHMATMEYELIGTLLGLAIHNAVILDVSFPHIVYKKLMGCALGLQDLELALPELGRGLRQLLNFKGDVKEAYQRNFEYSYEIFGMVKTVGLKPGGSTISVDNANREEYVALYVDYVLNKSVTRQYTAFHHGFHQVCNSDVLSMFRWEELQLLICGSSDLDFKALEEATLYEDGFTKDSEIIRAFWVIVHALPLKDKKKLLRFATGSDRVPIRGLSNLVFVISRNNGPDSDRLPTAHTCFNHLLLPEYSSRDKLKERLLIAINQAEGFGLR
ncbi:E3 ubiquitin protein ligase [Plasmopara halstedii]|uniref:HECT-type E3 ubiquitin transferase n=1 Tax=Plasmopara halstedii TaxID=4781 RepID=A0A0P1AX37_PLAHL|nr:E3 ubiquitin protein ligase [Plasmopara halstedii]CEG46973.1 E3 ubiquitin protein ligase [Plasmopara halstedii]|eukprot:XP_024583342.1 E3 ubiquitin protein ligase [Plasmopara halstedii]